MKLDAIIASLALGLTLILGACGGDDGEVDETTTPTDETYTTAGDEAEDEDFADDEPPEPMYDDPQ